MERQTQSNERATQPINESSYCISSNKFKFSNESKQL